MAHYAATVLDALRTQYPNNYDKNEARTSKYGALDLFKKQMGDGDSFLSQQARGLIQNSLGNAAEVKHPVLNAETVTVTTGSTTTCSMPSDNDATSALVVTAAPTIYTFGFTMIKDAYIQNDIGYTASLNQKLFKFDNQLAADLDVAAVTAIAAAKNQHYPAAITDYYAAVGDALRVPQVDKDDMYNQLSSIISEMDFGDGSNDILANEIHRPLVNRFINQGAGNSTNEAFQFAGFNWNYDNTSRLANGVGVESSLYLVKSGSLGIETRIPESYKQGAEIAGKKKLTMTLPISGLECAVLYQEDCNDESALAIGEARTDSFREGWSFEVQVYLLTVYNSAIATRFNPIQKLEILA